ncbi:MAG: DUF4114 domain-containing protein [Gammaproteobacteria bacterium]|nr:DUF4114 domain-containing protein [Gammaproteobacteria bacterium]
MKFLRRWHLAYALAGTLFTGSAMGAPQNLLNIFNDVDSNGINAVATSTVDLNSLVLDQSASLTAYFIGESAGARNAFYWYTLNSAGNCCQTSGRIWNNASAIGSGGGLRLGDEVALGNFSAGDSLGFAMYARANNPRRFLFTHDQFNPGGSVQAVGGLIPSEGLLLLGWEDLYGPNSDYDFTDLVVAIDIGVANANVLAAGAPEPGQWLLLTVGVVTLVGYGRRRQGAPVTT